YVLQHKQPADAGRAIPALVAALKDAEVLVRPAAGLSLATLDPDHPALPPALMDMLKDERLKVQRFPYGAARQRALTALLRLKPSARKAAIPFLIEEVERHNDQQAIVALGEFGADAKAAVPVLLRMLERRPPLPEVSITALHRIDPEALKRRPD